MVHGETQLLMSIPVLEISGLNSISPAHQVITVINTVLRGSRFAVHS